MCRICTVQFRTFILSVFILSLFCLRPLTYIWEKKDGELPPLAKVDGSFLRFEMLNKSDNGVYICHADNGIGDGQGEYTLLVQGKQREVKKKGGLTVRKRDECWEKEGVM